MNFFSSLFHKRSTTYPQADILLRLDKLERANSQNQHENTLLTRSMQDFEERTTRRLDRYRKWFAARSKGKFAKDGLEDGDQSSNGLSGIPQPTHAQIRSEAKRQGLIS